MASRSTPIAAGRLAMEQGANQTGACTAILEEQLSRVTCIARVNFGCRDGVVWAQRCRGRFSCKEIGVSFLCGWPITGEERRCRCDGQETWSATSCLANVGATVRTRSPPPQGVQLKSTRIASGSDCSTAARIAIGFFGAMRSITLVARSIRTNLLVPLRHAGGVDVFVHGLTGADIYEGSDPTPLQTPRNPKIPTMPQNPSMPLRGPIDASCQGLLFPDVACGRATLQRYLTPCRVQVEVQADIDRRYRFGQRARCDVSARFHVRRRPYEGRLCCRLKGSEADRSRACIALAELQRLYHSAAHEHLPRALQYARGVCGMKLQAPPRMFSIGTPVSL